MEFPLEIGHMEEIEEHIEEQEDSPTQAVLAPVRMAPSSAAGTIQYVKTDAGLIQVRNATPTQVVSRTIPVARNFVVKSATTQQGQKTYVLPRGAPQQTVTKTITMAQAQQMGLISTTGSLTSGRLVTTLNPTIKSEPGTVKVPATLPKPIGQVAKVRQVVTAQPSPRAIQTASGAPGQSRVSTSKAAVSAAKAVQYIEVVEGPRGVVKPEQPVAVVHRKGVARPEHHNVKVSAQAADRLLQLEGTVVIPGHNQSKVVMLPPDYLNHLSAKASAEAEREQAREELMAEVVDEGDIIVQSISPTPETDMIDLSTKKRPCNCTKSQCLKLYCECFANGEFCSDCNCKDCCNTMEHEDDRQAAIYGCLERNPNAFRPKIGKVSTATVGLRHHKGCHCKRSGCLKNYCECFEAKIPCSEMCKCVECKNSDEHMGPKHYGSGKTVSAIKRAAAAVDGELRLKPCEDEEPPPKQPYNFMTADVVDATVQCMMAQADECQQNGVSYRNTERLILEEFGRCLAEIIDFSTKNTDCE